MKVGTVVSSISRTAGGMFNSVRELSLATAAACGASVSVFGVRDEFSDVDRRDWLPLPVRLATRIGPRSIGFAPALPEHLLAADLDVVHSHGVWMYASAAVAMWGQRLKRPYVVSPHGMLDPWALRQSGWKKSLARALYENRHLRGASCLRALCDAEARAMRSFGLTNPIATIPNGIAPRAPTDVPTPEWRADIGRDTKVLLFLGRIHPKKGLEPLLRSWSRENHARAGAEGSQWALAIAGWDQNQHQRELEQLVQQLGIERSVKFIGPQFGDAKDAALAHSDAFVLPSFSEGLPMAVLEAWSFSLPVIMTAECNIPEGFQVGAALKAEPEASSLSAALEKLFVLSEEDRRLMGARGLELVNSRFQWSAVGRDMASVYAWLLEGAPQPTCVTTV